MNGLCRSGEEHQLVGLFDSADAAARAYDQAALKMHGPEAYTNFLCECLFTHLPPLCAALPGLLLSCLPTLAQHQAQRLHCMHKMIAYL